jgi:hypothetical protein
MQAAMCEVKEMIKYVVYNSEGKILRYGSSQENVTQANQGEFQLNIDWPSDIEDYAVSDGNLVRKPQSELDAENLQKNVIELRSDRNLLLTSSDWTQVPDAPVDRSAWAAYRQQLRDLPENTTDPANPVWPTPPQ